MEGLTDVLALEALAARLGRDLEREGVAVVSLGGGGGLRDELARLVPTGVELRGFCDLDHERRWARRLEEAGLGHDLDRAGMEALGFFVCERDLEDELIRAAGPDAVERLIAEQGDARSLETLRKQPYHRNGDRHEQLRRFFTSQSGRKRYIPLLVDAIAPGAEPRPLRKVLARAS